MNEPVIHCPTCSTEIKLTESLAAPLIAETRRQFEKALAAKDAEVAKREAALRSREGELAAAKASIDEQVAAKVKAERAAIAADEAKKAKLLAASDLEQKAKELSALQEVLRRLQDGQFTGGNELPAGVADLIVASVLLLVLVKRPYGLMGVRELGLPPGGDHRRVFPPGKEMSVVVVNRAGGRLTLSATQVARVEERKNYRDFAGTAGATPACSLGSLGDLLRSKFGSAVPSSPAEPTAASAGPAAREPPIAGPSAAAPETAASSAAPKGSEAERAPKGWTDGVVRRRR